MLQTRVVGRYDDIDAALHDPDTFSSAPTVPDPPSPWRERFAGRVPTRGTLLGLDNPDHDRLRAAVNTFFMPRRLARYEPWIRERAYRLVDGFVKDGQTNLKTSFALPLALQVISHVVGLDADRWEWIGAALGFILGPRDIHHPGTPEEKAQLLPDLHDHILEVMTERRRKRRDDLISHVWEQRDAGVVEMTDFEMLSLFPGLLPAATRTSSNLICTGLSHPLADPTRYAGAQRDDDSRAAALEELFRYESAITGMRRLVTRDTMLAGVPLRTGEQLFLAYASGSRDARRFAAPDEIDLDRSWAAPHLGFGQGVHACLGAPLARLLLRIELGILHERAAQPAGGCALRRATTHSGLRGPRHGGTAAGLDAGPGDRAHPGAGNGHRRRPGRPGDGDEPPRPDARHRRADAGRRRAGRRARVGARGAHRP